MVMIIGLKEIKYKRVNHKNGKVSHQCPVKVRFYMIDDGGEEVDLSGKQIQFHIWNRYE